MSEPNDKQLIGWYGESSLISGGLIGIGLIITQAFISLGTYDIPVIGCICAFSIALPLLAWNVMLRHLLIEKNKKPETNGSGFLFATGIFFSLIGIEAAFLHVSWIAAVLLLVSGAIGFAVYGYYVNKYE